MRIDEVMREDRMMNDEAGDRGARCLLHDVLNTQRLHLRLRKVKNGG